MGRIEKNSDFVSKVFKTELASVVNVLEDFKRQTINVDSTSEFVDNLFQENINSIYSINSNNSKLNKEEIVILSEYKMLPFSQIFRNFHNLEEVFTFEITSKITFGPLANINLFSCLLFLAIFRPRIQSMFFVISVQRAFRIRLIIQGKIKTVLVDENLAAEAFNNKSPLPSFIRTNSKNSWINFIEKALAKVKKGYSNILKLKCSEIFPYLSEAPSMEYEHIKTSEDKKKIWNIFFRASKRNWIIFTEFNSESLKSSSLEENLKEAVFILLVFQVQEERFVKVYFPSKMYDSMISLFKVDTNHEIYKEESYIKTSEFNSKQILLIKFEDYYNIMEKTFVLKYEESYSYYYKKYKVSNQNYQSSKFRIYRNTKLTLSMLLKNNNHISRMILVRLARSEEGTSNTENSIEVVTMSQKMTKITSAQMSQATSQLSSSRKKNKKSINNIKDEMALYYVDSSFGKTDKHILEVNLEEGTYIILFKVSLEDIPMSVVLSLYSEYPVKLEEYFDAEELKIFDFNNQTNSYLSIFRSYLTMRGQSDVIENLGDFHINSSLNDSKFGFSCIEFSNFSKTKILCVNLGYDYNGMHMISHEMKKKLQSNTSFQSNGTGNEVLKVFPGNKEIILFEWDKTNTDINLNFYPKFYTENLYFDNEKLNKIENLHKKVISQDLYYYEILNKSKIYLVFCNQNPKVDYKLQVEIQSLNNLAIANVKNLSNRLNVTIMRASKEMVLMKIIKINEESSYKMNFSPQSLY
jgi:hypothetical protein